MASNTGYKISKGQIANPTGRNQYASRPKELIAFHKNTCVEAAGHLIARMMDIALHGEPKLAYLCAKDLLDRGLGRPQQSISVESGNTGQALSAQQTLEVLDKAIKQEEANEALTKRILELEEQIKWLNEQPGKAPKPGNKKTETECTPP